MLGKPASFPYLQESAGVLTFFSITSTFLLWNPLCPNYWSSHHVVPPELAVSPPPLKVWGNRVYVGVIQVATLLPPKPPPNDLYCWSLQSLLLYVFCSLLPWNFSLALPSSRTLCTSLFFTPLCLPLGCFSPGLGSAGFSVLGYLQDILLNGNFCSYSLLVILLDFAPRAIFFSQQNDTPKGVSKRNSPC